MSRSVSVALALLAAACAGAPSTDRVPRQVVSRAGDLGSVVDGNSVFAWDLYRQIAADDPDNLFLSPFSVSAALGMTLAGADGDTLTEMSQVLGLSVPEPAWHDSFGGLIRDLNGEYDRGYTLYVANRLWGQEGYPFEDPFLATCAEDYGAPLEPWDFVADPEGGRERVNEWVLEQTQDRIADLLPAGSVTSDTRLVLANAIYFLGDWVAPFDPDDTRDGPFTLLDGSTVTAPIMSLDTGIVEENLFSMGFIEGGTIVRLPYQDDELSMLLVVPDAIDGLPALEAGIDAAIVDGWIGALGAPGARFFLQMPTFEMTYEVDLVPVLGALGLSTPFSAATANFDRMAQVQPDGRLFITGVYHKAFVKVDEVGTEAAGASGVVVGVESAPPVVDATHPFLFLIRDDLTGSLLFIGRVADPTAGE